MMHLDRTPNVNRTMLPRRALGALALSAALVAAFGAVHPAGATPAGDAPKQCMQMGSMIQCMGAGGMSQTTGTMTQATGAFGTFQSGGSVQQSQVSVQGSNVVQSQSSVQISGNGNSVQTVTSNGGSVQTITSNGNVVTVQSSTALASLPTDVPVAMIVDRGDGATYRVGEPIQVAYAINQPTVFRIVSLQNGAAVTLVEGSGDGTRGQVSAVAGPAAGQQIIKLVGLASDGSVREAVVTLNVVG